MISQIFLQTFLAEADARDEQYACSNVGGLFILAGFREVDIRVRTRNDIARMYPSEEFPCAGIEQLLVSVRLECPKHSIGWKRVELRLSETSAERPRSAAKIPNGGQQFDNGP